VTIGTIDNNQGTGNGGAGCYTSFTNLSTVVLRSNAYPITVYIPNGYAGDQAAVWADWNQDSTFAAGEQITLTPHLGADGTPANFTGTITPPATATLGNTRLRIRVSYNDVALSPCGNTAGYGEVEDYTLVVVASGACCDASGGCSITASNACSGSNFIGAGSTCTPTNPCLGSCCASSGSCNLTTPGVCSGHYVPSGTCAAADCNGACCTSAGACTSTNVSTCSSAGSYFIGVAAACSPTPCSVGACCTSGSCSAVISSACAAGGGTFFASGSCTAAPGSPTQGTHAIEDISATGPNPGNSFVLTGGSLDDGYNLNLPIGFTFNFFGTPQTTINIATNGVVYFGATGYSGYPAPTTIPTAGTQPLNSIAPHWQDLIAPTAGNITYLTEGNAPARRFVVLWNNMQRYGVAGSSVTFEMILYETADAIEFRYGNLDSTVPTTGTNLIVGAENSTGTLATQFSTGGPATAAALGSGNISLVFQAGANPCTTSTPTGACCSNGCSAITYGACIAAGGAFQGNATTCTTAPCVNGGCCGITGGCTLQVQAICNSNSGFYQGNNTVCGQTPCPPGGICCNGTACAASFQAGCSGTFTANGSCSPNPCAGSCCDAGTGACTLVTGAGACSGTFGGPGTTCTPTNNCSGACCNTTSGACVNSGNTGCAAGTVFQGIGMVCDAAPSVLCGAGACCNSSNGLCTVTTSGGCAQTFQSVGTSCTPNPCPQPPPPANDDCATVLAGANTITDAGGTFSCNLVGSTNDGTACIANLSRDVYFKFTPTMTGTWGFSTCTGSDAIDTVISVHTDCPTSTANQIACNDDSCGLLSNLPSVALTGGTQYIVRVALYAATSTPGNATLTVMSVVSGACCNSTSGACTAVINQACTVGTYQGDGTICDAAPSVLCGAGACCNAGTGACTITTSGGCAQTFQSVGTSCTPNPCPQPPTGACCNSTNGACTQVFASNCNLSTSTYTGDNTTCAASGFCPGNGTCCSSLGTCTVSYTASCPTGLTFNAATSCTTGLCPVTGASICQNFDADAVGTLPTGYSSTVNGGGAAWAIDATHANSAPNAVFTNDIATVSSQFLQLPPVTVGSGGALTLDFVSYFDTEPTFDGFVVETSTDGGSTWTDVVINGTWVLNGYNQAAISTAFMSPIAGRPAFSGVFTSWTEHIATVPFPAGTSVIFHFWMASDNSVAHTGVWLDNICIGGIAGGATGVCCRGSTCTTSVSSAAACTASLSGALAGSTFPTSASCNSGGSTTSPCCYPDYNKVNGIGVPDIFDFLNDWFAGRKFAIVGGDGNTGTLSVQNIFDFLNAWFAGGC
jgi:hypothetical protein